MVDPEELFEINLTISGKKFPLNVKRKDEKIYRDAADRLNDLLGRYKRTFKDNDPFEALAMTSIQLARNLVLLEQDKTNEILWQTVTEINERLDSVEGIKP